LSPRRILLRRRRDVNDSLQLVERASVAGKPYTEAARDAVFMAELTAVNEDFDVAIADGLDARSDRLNEL
jgi:hypothetical protein